MSRKGQRKDKEEPEDPLDKEIGKTVRFERALTEIKQKQYDRKIIAVKLKQLEDSKKQPEQTFLFGSSVSETEQIVKELPGNKFNLFMTLGYFADQSKKLKPEELRKELLALVKMIPLANPSDENKAFLNGMKTAGDFIKIVQAAGLKGSPGSASGGSKDFGGKPVGGASKESSPSIQDDPQLILVVNNSFGSTEAGGIITIPFYVSGYSESVEFAVAGVKGLPGLEGRITHLAPFRSSKLFEGQWTLTIPVSASPGEHQLTLVALDPKDRISKVPYFLTIR